jgi:hypothetical protein
MHRSYRFIASLFLAAALMAPVSIMAAPKPQASVQVRVYDDHEDAAYRAYLTDQHITYRVYAKQNHKTQSNYWNWRHSHPDHN